MDAGKDRAGSDRPMAGATPRRSYGEDAQKNRARKPGSSAAFPADSFRYQAEQEYGRTWRPGALRKLVNGAAASIERTASLMEEMVASRAATIADLTEVQARIDKRQNEIDAMLDELVRAGAPR